MLRGKAKLEVCTNTVERLKEGLPVITCLLVSFQVTPLTPSDQTLFPDADWLIGNHSDELTPWVPLMAAR